MTAVDATAIKEAEEAINTNGFVTEKELPDLHDINYARELSDKLIKSRENQSEKGYIYTEPFDFVGGKISNIVWNMDRIKTRKDAEAALAKDLNWSVVQPQLSSADKATF
ncbi:hypothetical protein ACFQ5J_03100 [Lacticaseibacillus baoqingensis]|uniref:Uncharacterized protein n=1 Tax=Lacticaseibacillus baoqingensis TaxID=2486013 RepID=A0ABW4E4W8_9LACO|nr:hypothetical protein [Lacticaseibacillus baoqingensis]